MRYNSRVIPVMSTHATQNTSGITQLALDTATMGLISEPTLRTEATNLHAFQVMQPLGILLMSISTVIDIYRLQELYQKEDQHDRKIQEKQARLLRKLSFDIPALLLGYTSLFLKLVGVAALTVAASYIFMAAASLSLVYNVYELIYNITKSIDSNISHDAKAEYRQEAASKAVSIVVLSLVLAACILLMSNPVGIGCAIAGTAAGIMCGLLLWEMLKFIKPFENSNISVNQCIKSQFSLFKKEKYEGASNKMKADSSSPLPCPPEIL